MTDVLPTHGELVNRAVAWLMGAGGCDIAFSEMGVGHGERPDAVGWGAYCVLVECKTSLPDYRADLRKPRHILGDLRYVMTPPKTLRPSELRQGWGLLETNGQSVRKIVESAAFADRNLRSEIGFLVEMLSRAERRLAPGEGPRGTALNQWLRFDRRHDVASVEATL